MDTPLTLTVDDYELELLQDWIAQALAEARAVVPAVDGENDADEPAWLVNANHEEHTHRLQAFQKQVREVAARWYRTGGG